MSARGRPGARSGAPQQQQQQQRPGNQSEAQKPPVQQQAPRQQQAERDLSSHLGNSSVPMAALHGVCSRHLLTLLGRHRGPKALVLDPELQRFVDLIMTLPKMQQAGVQDFPEWSSPGVVASEAPKVVFLVRPDPQKMRHIAARIQAEQKQLRSPRSEYVVACVPKLTKLCLRELEDAGVLGDVTTTELPVELLPLEEDLLSMELNDSFSDLFLHEDTSSLVHAARALVKLQAMFGRFVTISGHGLAAVRAADLLHRTLREAEMDNPGSAPSGPGGIDELILLDRSSDLVTPLLTQRTYEGLVDEIFHIQKGFIKVDPSIVDASAGSGSDAPSDKLVLLNGQDSLFKEIRDFHFATLGPYLHKKAELVMSTYEERHDAQSVRDLHAFLPKFKNANTEHALLQLHVNLARAISQVTKTTKFDRRQEAENDALRLRNPKECDEYAEQMFWKMENKVEMYRYLCLVSHTVGFKNLKRFDSIKHEIVSSYGFAELFTLENLEKAGVLRHPNKKKYWPVVRKHFNLVVEEPRLSEPSDIAYTYGGYAPLLVRTVEMAAQNGWKSVDDGLSGPTFTKLQDQPEKGKDPLALQQVPPASSGRRKPVALVFFLGGVTYAEIAALRLLSENSGRDYIVATTQILNGQTMVGSLQQNFDAELILDAPAGGFGRRR